MAVTDEEKKLARAYNIGYTLSTYEPRLLDKLIKSNPNNEFVQAMQIGRDHHEFHAGIPRKGLNREFKNGYYNGRTLAEHDPGMIDRLKGTKGLNKNYKNGLEAAQKEYTIRSIQQKINEEPKTPAKELRRDESFQKGFNNKAFEGVRDSIAAEYRKWKETWSEEEKIRFADREVQEKAFIKRVHQARDFRFVEQFFFETFKTLSFKTKSIIILSSSSFLFELLQDPIYTLFCSDDEETTVTPESSLAGKVVLLDLPTKIYHGAGKSAQALYKFIFQLQSEKRDKTGDVRPCCIWADENAEWISSYDPIYQSSCRDSLIAIVNICQNVNQYLSALGGKNSAEKVASFLATLNTKIWFSNGCPATNSMASLLIGDTLFFDPSRTIQAP